MNSNHWKDVLNGQVLGETEGKRRHLPFCRCTYRINCRSDVEIKGDFASYLKHWISKLILYDNLKI